MKTINTNIVIFGAGVAGLWLHNQLNALGYHCLLIEKNTIGGTQTLSSQGIIHGGIKYTLNGILSRSASEISDMPSRWLQCLKGEGDIDLSLVKILTRNQLMWSKNNLSAKLTSFFSSKALNSKIKPVSIKNRPNVFQSDQFQGNLYQLNEPVIDTYSLVKNLSFLQESRILKLTKNYKFIKDDQGLNSIILDNRLTIIADQFIFAAGEGNADLLKDVEQTSPIMQKRPLQMILAKGNSLPSLYAHCIGTNAKPLLTITTHPQEDGSKIWYIGGNIAEEGIKKSPQELIATSKLSLKNLIPWINTDNLQWATHYVNRAEPLQNNLSRPDAAYVHQWKNLITAWPTKLALTPNLADKIIKEIEHKNFQKISSQENDHCHTTLLEWKKSNPLNMTPTLWETAFNAL